MNKYYYGMRLRGFSPACQPIDGLVKYEDADKNWTGYYGILTYNRELTKEEMSNYDLSYIEMEEE